MGPTTIGHFPFMISYLTMSPAPIFPFILLCREENRKILKEFPWPLCPNISLFYFYETNYPLTWWLGTSDLLFFIVHGLAGMASPGLLMSHIQLGQKAREGPALMPDGWYKFSASAPWSSFPWSLTLQGTSLASLCGDLRKFLKIKTQPLKLSWSNPKFKNLHSYSPVIVY